MSCKSFKTHQEKPRHLYSPRRQPFKESKHHLTCTFRAARFEVTVDFLFQQVTYLTERHASQVRAQMRKVTAAARSSAAPSPVPGSESGAALEALRRTGSAQGLRSHTRAPSSLSIRKDSPMLRNDGSIPSTPKTSTPDSAGAAGVAGRPQVSRASSSGTAVQVGSSGSGAGSLRLKTKPPSPRAQPRHRLSSLPLVTSPTLATPTAEQAAPTAAADPSSPAADESPSPTSSASSSPAQSRIIRRPPRFNLQQQRDQADTRLSYLGDADDEEAEPAFLPFKSTPGHGVDGSDSGDGSAHYNDPSATLRGDPRDFAANAARRLDNITGPGSSQGKGKGKEKEQMLQRSQTSDSSASSAAFLSKRSLADRRPPSGPLSPRRTTELKGKGYSREGSDGTPSMGSSFSDLDGKIMVLSLALPISLDADNLFADASVTQSALEEALASKMQGGNTIGSTISNVFRSRYLPK